MILGLIGLPGTGKGTIAEILRKKFDAEVYLMSDPLWKILKALQLEPTREHVAALSLSIKQNGGEYFLAEALRLHVATAKPLLVIDGIRRLADIAPIRSRPDFHLVGVQAPFTMRLERLRRRRRDPMEGRLTPKTLHQQDMHPNESEVPTLLSKCAYTILNNDTRQHLENLVSHYLKTFQQKT
ncbi:MAG: AAA family ATPase [Patescibacteria group bacterium]|jgi:dephospho-CoA kinase